MTIASSKKLWRITKSYGEYYYEIKYDGDVIDRIRIDIPAKTFLELHGELHGEII